MKLASAARRAIVAGAVSAMCQLTAVGSAAYAQVQRPAQPDNSKRSVDAEVRLDGIISRVSAVQLGAGLTTVMGIYLRTGVVGAVGFSRNGVSARVDGFTRFHFDPFRQSRWAPYGGGGISGRFERRDGARAYLLLLLGLDGPINKGVTPSVEIGLGGGARIGVALRQATGERR